jgi:hypothetical protein
MLISGNLVAAAFFANQAAVPKGIAALDTTAPTVASRSYVGFAEILDPAHLDAIPAAQWGTIESFGSTGNFRVEAHGRAAIDDAAVGLSVDESAPPGFVHLTWTGVQATFDVQRASKPDFSDGSFLATGVPTTSFDDPAFNDGRSWFYRVR